jgi:molecular chaperone GrpE (heat shock protein)
VHSLGQRLEALEEMTMRNLEATQFQKIEGQLAAIRETESVNQKLFDSLHQELISYRDNFMRESLQKPFIRDLLVLFDDLRAVEAQLEQAAPSETDEPIVQRARGNLHNTVHFLLEVLRRLEVTEVEEKETVDLSIHRVTSFEPAEAPEEDGRIVRRIRRGFTWRGKLLRPEEVVAKRVR